MYVLSLLSEVERYTRARASLVGTQLPHVGVSARPVGLALPVPASGNMTIPFITIMGNTLMHEVSGTTWAPGTTPSPYMARWVLVVVMVIIEGGVVRALFSVIVTRSSFVLYMVMGWAVLVLLHHGLMARRTR